MSEDTKYHQITNNQSSNVLIFNYKLFHIPNDFRFINDIDPNIYNSLKTNHKYIVKSIISEEVFKSFINYWIKREIPDFRLENIKEYEIISQEFDYMKDLIQMFEKFPLNYFETNEKFKNKELKQLLKEKTVEFDKQKQKYHQIMEYLFTNNLNNSCFMLSENKSELFDAAEKNKSYLVNFLTQKSVIQGGLSFILDEKKLTATLFHIITSNDEIIIPRSIEYAFKKFKITTISKSAFNSSNKIQIIQFSDDSELQTICKQSFSNSSLVTFTIPKSVTSIEKLAFSGCSRLKSIQFQKNSELNVFESQLFAWSDIESITIPSSIEEMKDGWCSDVLKLKNITINQENIQNISLFDNSLIVGKSDKKSDKFDVIQFARRDIEKVTIPSVIHSISPYSFEYCAHLKNITFSEQSDLRLIDKYAFKSSSIESLSIPDRLDLIGDFAFFMCNRLKNVYFSEDSELHSIGRFAFSKSSIEAIEIPNKVIQIGESAFCGCKKLKSVTFSEDSQLKVIGNSMFSWSAVNEVVIPHHITKIGDMTFSYCYQLKKVEFSDDSELKIIGNFAFSNSSIESLNIPSELAVLSEGWCCGTPNLNDVKISSQNKHFTFCDDSFIARKSSEKGQFFDIIVFAPRNIEKVAIPPFIERIESYAFQLCERLLTVDFIGESSLASIGNYAFTSSSLMKFSIPQSARMIGEFAFYGCSKLKKFFIPEKSCLIEIDQFAFGFTALKSFYVPSSVVQIADFAFSDCKSLQIVEFADDSKIRSIKNNAFIGSSIEIITLPANSQNIYLNSFILNLSK